MRLNARVSSCATLCFLLVYVNAQRAVTVMVDWGIHGLLPQGDLLLLPGHAAMHIAGDSNNGPVRIQVAYYKEDFSLDFLDYGVGNAKQPIGLYADAADPNTDYPQGRRLLYAGTITLSNAELVDGATGGAGLATDIVTDPAGPFNGKYTSGTAGCMVFVQTMLRRLFPDTKFPVFDAWVEKYQLYVARRYPDPSPQTLRVAYRLIQSWGDDSKNTIKIFKILGHNNLQLLGPPEPQGPDLVLQDESTMYGRDVEIASPWAEQMPPSIEVNGSPVESPFALAAQDGSPTTSTSEGVGDLAVARVNNVMTTIALVPKVAIQATGAAAAIVAAVFVILDFVHGKWVGGAIGAVGLALGVAATAALAGPIGWIVGGIIAALFAILPGLFTGGKNMPLVGNMTQVIQFKMFGDALHTGNEKCREQNPSCQAVYGPGTLSASFGWDYFDAITFLIHFNKGYPVTIPDMADAFQVNGTAGSIAVMDCHNGKWETIGAHGAGTIGDNPKYCNHPQFGMGRDFELPVINDTAASVFNRIIPAPGGDCKLVDAASNAQSFPDYGLTVSGLPVSIACNITASTTGNWSSVDPGSFANSSNIKSNNVSPANSSTNNEGGAYIAPPAPVPFAVAFNATNSVCVSNSSNTFCLPNGTYDKPTGMFGYTMTAANAVTLCEGCSISLQNYYTLRADAKPQLRTFNTSQAASSSSFTAAIKNFNVEYRADQFFVNIPDTVPVPPSACFYTKTQYLGDLFCIGPGGANFTGNGIHSVQSVAVFGGATVWIYAKSYGDAGGARLTTSVADLSTEPYGTGGDFLKKTVAAWIYESG